jgi:hypothetical protein
MHHSVRRAYIALTDTSRRYTAGIFEPGCRHDAARGRNLTFGGIELEVDKYANYGTMYGSTPPPSCASWKCPASDQRGRRDPAPVGSGTTFTDEWEAAYRIWQNSTTSTRTSRSGSTASLPLDRQSHRVMRCRLPEPRCYST